MAVGGQAQVGQHAVQLAPGHRDGGDALGEGHVRVEPEEPVLAGHRAGRVDPLDRDVVEVARPVHGRPGVGLGHDQPLRVPRERGRLGRQRADDPGPALSWRSRPRPVPGTAAQRQRRPVPAPGRTPGSPGT